MCGFVNTCPGEIKKKKRKSRVMGSSDQAWCIAICLGAAVQVLQHLSSLLSFSFPGCSSTCMFAGWEPPAVYHHHVSRSHQCLELQGWSHRLLIIYNDLQKPQNISDHGVQKKKESQQNCRPPFPLKRTLWLILHCWAGRNQPPWLCPAP